MHFHRDVLAICDCFSRHLLQPTADDVFCGTPPLAFTFGLGGLALFPMREGAASLLLEQAAPAELADGDRDASADRLLHRADRLPRAAQGWTRSTTSSSLKKCVSAGEHLPKATWELVREKLGIELIDGIGATEMLHIFIAAARRGHPPRRDRQAGAGLSRQGRRRQRAARSSRHVGRLAVKGPTGCRYLADRAPARLCAGRLEPHRRQLRAWTRTAISGSRRAPTT